MQHRLRRRLGDRHRRARRSTATGTRATSRCASARPTRRATRRRHAPAHDPQCGGRRKRAARSEHGAHGGPTPERCDAASRRPTPAWRRARSSRALGLRDHGGDRPRVVAAMIASADGRAAVDGRSVGARPPRRPRAAARAAHRGRRDPRRHRHAARRALREPARRRPARAPRGRGPEPEPARRHDLARGSTCPPTSRCFAEPSARVAGLHRGRGRGPGAAARGSRVHALRARRR